MRKLFILMILVAGGLVACTNYGKKVKSGHVEVYYKDGISSEQAQKTADLLYLADKETNKNTTAGRSVQLIKNGDTINFRMVVDEKKLAGKSDEVFQRMGNVISDSIFNGKPVNVELTDNKFKTIRIVKYKKEEMAFDPGAKVTSGNIEVYTKDNFSSTEAQTLADFLESSIAPPNIISFQISNDEQGNYLLRMVSTPEKASKLEDKEFEDMAAMVSDKVFNGKPVVFQLTDDRFQPFKTFYHQVPGK